MQCCYLIRITLSDVSHISPLQDADDPATGSSPPHLVVETSTPNTPKPYTVAGLAHTTKTLTIATSNDRYRAFLMHLATALCSSERVAAAPVDVDPADVPSVEGQPHGTPGELAAQC